MTIKCANCGKLINGKPIEVDGEPFCSLGCYDEGNVFEEEDFTR